MAAKAAEATKAADAVALSVDVHGENAADVVAAHYVLQIIGKNAKRAVNIKKNSPENPATKT